MQVDLDVLLGELKFNLSRIIHEETELGLSEYCDGTGIPFLQNALSSEDLQGISIFPSWLYST